MGSPPRAPRCCWAPGAARRATRRPRGSAPRRTPWGPTARRRATWRPRSPAPPSSPAAPPGAAGQAMAAAVTQEEDVTRVFARAEELGGAAVLVNAAGTNRPGPARGYPLEDWEALFAVNVRGTFLTCRAFGDAALRR